jgi:HEAT repeat protein
MPRIRTYGRNPTLGEVKEYYAREDVLTFLNYTCKKRKVIFSFKDEPSLKTEANTPPLEPRNIAHLHQIITEGIEEKMQGIADDARPSAYPSFHGMTSKDGDVISDFVMEADCHGWRRSFVDVRGAIQMLDEFQVPYIAKFSGHRSLHVMVPREAFPEEFDGVPIGRSWKSLEKRLRDFFHKCALVRYAHGTGGILRLPYSLNENTGMVSLPMNIEELDDFRPWEAILHLVGNVSQDLFDVSADDRDRTSQFLHAALIEKRIRPLKGKMWMIQPKRNLSKYRHLVGDLSSDLGLLDSDDPVKRTEAAWKLMISDLRVPDEIFEKYARESDAGVRWFIAEALMGDERAMELLHEMDEYAADAIDDSASLAAVSFLEKLLGGTAGWDRSFDTAMNIHAIFERSAGLLRDEIIRQAEIIPKDKSSMLLRCVSILGGAADDWDAVSKVAAMLEQRFPSMADIVSQDVFNNIRRLGSENRDEGRMAEEALIAAGKRATDALILAMGTADHWMRKSVISILCRVGDPRSIACLVNALGDPGGKIRRMALHGILRLKPKPKALKELLLDAAESDNPRLRANATKILRSIDEAAALRVALGSLKDRDPKVRKAAVKSLAKIGGSLSMNGLEHALADEDRSVAIDAAFALAEMGHRGATMLRVALKDDRAQTARCAAHGLVSIGDPSGIDLLIDAFNDDEWDVWSTPWTLAKSGDKRAIEALADFVETSLHAENMSGKARLAGKALGSCAHQRALDVLKKMMYTRRDRSSRRAAVMALRGMGTPEAVDVLLEALVSEDGNLRQHARNVLVKMGPETLPRLKTLVDQVEGRPRRAVESLVQSLSKER